MKGHVRQRPNGRWVFVLSPQELAQRCIEERHLHWVDLGVISRCKQCDAQMNAPALEWRKKWHGSFDTEDQAEKALKEALGLLDQGRDPFPTAIRVHEFVPRWLTHKAQRTRPTSLAGYRRPIAKFVLPEIGALRLDRVRVAHIQKILDKATATGSSARTVQQLRAVCSSMFSTAVKWEMISHNPVRGAETPKAERPDLEVPTAAQANALIEQARETPWAVPILVAVTLGTRRSETLALKWSDIDLDRGRVSIVRNLQRVPGEGLKFFDPKSRRSRRLIVLPPFVVPILRTWRKAQMERRLQAGPVWVDLDLVCDRGDGAPFDPDAFSHATKRLMRAAGFHPATRLHDCRHAFATVLLEQGVDTAVVSAVLGHATTWFTADTYQHVREGMAEHAASAIEQALRG